MDPEDVLAGRVVVVANAPFAGDVGEVGVQYVCRDNKSVVGKICVIGTIYVVGTLGMVKMCGRGNMCGRWVTFMFWFDVV